MSKSLQEYKDAAEFAIEGLANYVAREHEGKEFKITNELSKNDTGCISSTIRVVVMEEL